MSKKMSHLLHDYLGDLVSSSKDNTTPCAPSAPPPSQTRGTYTGLGWVTSTSHQPVDDSPVSMNRLQIQRISSRRLLMPRSSCDS